MAFHAGYVVAIIIGVVVFAITSCLIASCALRHKVQDSAVADKTMPPPIPLVRRGEPIELALQREYRRRLDRDVNNLLRDEQQKHRGEPVWVSVDRSQGLMRHWILLTCDKKYELRHLSHIDAEDGAAGLELLPIKTTKFSIGGGAYYLSTQSPSPLKEEERRIALASEQPTFLYDQDHRARCFPLLIGWTRKPGSDIDQACRDICDNFITRDLFRSNCQELLRQFAARIVDEQSKQWAWFLNTTASSTGIIRHREIRSDIVAGAWLRRLDRMKEASESATERQKLQAHSHALQSCIKNAERMFAQHAEKEWSWTYIHRAAGGYGSWIPSEREKNRSNYRQGIVFGGDGGGGGGGGGGGCGSAGG